MKPRLLIADSDAELRDVFRRFFSGSGFDVATAGAGLECLEQFRQFLPDVLVVEREMPWGGGEGVLGRLGIRCWPSALIITPRPKLDQHSGRRHLKYRFVEGAVGGGSRWQLAVVLMESFERRSRTRKRTMIRWNFSRQVETRRQQVQTARELAIEEQAQAELSNAPYLAVRRVSCQVKGGVLSLQGRVSSFYLKQVAQALLRRYLAAGFVMENRLDVVYEKAG
jgi:hypothetical protein